MSKINKLGKVIFFPVLLLSFSLLLKGTEKKLFKAAEKGDLKKVKMYIEKKKVNINAQEKDGDTALHEAAEEGHVEVVRYLLRKDADKTIKNKKGKTALDKAEEELKEEEVDSEKYKNLKEVIMHLKRKWREADPEKVKKRALGFKPVIVSPEEQKKAQ